MTTEVIIKDWKYHVKSHLFSFLAVFLPILFLEIRDLSMDTVGLAFAAGGVGAAVRAFLRLIVEPLASAGWRATVGLVERLAEAFKNR